MKDLLILLPFILVPAFAFAFVRPAIRRALGAVGLVFGPITLLLLGVDWDNVGASLPFLGFSLLIAALLGEALAFLVNRVRGRSRRAAGEGG